MAEAVRGAPTPHAAADGLLSLQHLHAAHARQSSYGQGRRETAHTTADNDHFHLLWGGFGTSA